MSNSCYVYFDNVKFYVCEPSGRKLCLNFVGYGDM